MPAELVKSASSGGLSRILAWLAAPFVRTASAPSRVAWELTEPLVVPAEGEAYDFTVDAVGTWIGNGIGRRRLNARIDRYEPAALRRLMIHIRSVARRFPPQQAGPAEEEMNRLLADGWEYDENVRFEVTFQVVVDEKLREQLAEATLKIIELENDSARSLRHSELLKDLIPCWRDLLTTAGRDLEARYSVQLADVSGEFAKAMHELIDEGLKRSDRLRDVLEQAVNTHKNVDMYEFVNSYDSALAALQTYLGIAAESLRSTPVPVQNGHRERGAAEPHG